jgi:hypothetical protein
MREEELSQGNEDRVNDERQDARRNQLLQYNVEWVNLPQGPNDNINQFFYDRLMLFAEDHNQDVMFYSNLLLHLQNSEIPDHDFMEILVLRDNVTGERIFPSKESAFQHLQQRIQHNTRARNEFVRLAQIIHRVAVVQGQPVDVRDEHVIDVQQPAEDAQAEEPSVEAEEPEVAADGQEVVTIGSDSTATFDTQPERH